MAHKDTLPIAAIGIPTRHRRELGDLAGLKHSMATIGLLHPIVVTTRHTLIAGGRRLEAARQLGWTEIAVTVAANLDTAIAVLKAERDENTERKDFTPSEAVALARALEPLERDAAKQRQREAGKTHGRGQQSTAPAESAEPIGETRNTIAAAVGMGRDKLAKACAVVEAAEHEPTKYAPLVAEMDRTGNVHGAYKQLHPPIRTVMSTDRDTILNECEALIRESRYRYRVSRSQTAHATLVWLERALEHLIAEHRSKNPIASATTSIARSMPATDPPQREVSTREPGNDQRRDLLVEH